MSINFKKSIPNTITLSNLFLGFVAIILLGMSLGGNDVNVKIVCYLAEKMTTNGGFPGFELRSQVIL